MDRQRDRVRIRFDGFACICVRERQGKNAFNRIALNELTCLQVQVNFAKRHLVCSGCLAVKYVVLGRMSVN